MSSSSEARRGPTMVGADDRAAIHRNRRCATLTFGRRSGGDLRTRGLLVFLALGCGGATVRGATAPAPAAADLRSECAAAATAGPEVWVRVQADGFSFCVPSTMRPIGSARWQGAGTIEWGVGVPPPLLLDPQERRDPIERDRRPSIAPRDTIDGRPASLWQVYSSGRYLTGVRFDEPRVFITGVASNERDRTLHQAVYRSIRFP